MGYGFGRRTANADFHQLGIPQDPRGEAFDLWRKRGREKESLSIGGNFFNDLPNLRQKSHVEHPIDFIEHENVYIAEMERALLEMIEQAARRRDDNIDATFQIFLLFAVTDAAVNNRGA